MSGKKDEELKARGFRFIHCVISIKVWEKFVATCGDRKPSDELSEVIVQEVERRKLDNPR